MDASPTKVKIQLDFFQALEQVLLGKKITRKEWGTVNVYGVLQDTVLKIYRDDKLHDWIVSEGDMRATDWVVIK